MKAQANANSSLLFSSCGLLATLVAASVFGGAVAATKMGTVCGGLFGASAFFNALHVITGLEAAINIRNQAGVVEVAFALLVAAMTGGIIHRVSVTTSVLFSLVALYYVMGASDAIHGGDSGVRVNPSKAPSRRKR